MSFNPDCSVMSVKNFVEPAVVVPVEELDPHGSPGRFREMVGSAVDEVLAALIDVHTGGLGANRLHLAFLVFAHAHEVVAQDGNVAEDLYPLVGHLRQHQTPAAGGPGVVEFVDRVLAIQAIGKLAHPHRAVFVEVLHSGGGVLAHLGGPLGLGDGNDFICPFPILGLRRGHGETQHDTERNT